MEGELKSCSLYLILKSFILFPSQNHLIGWKWNLRCGIIPTSYYLVLLYMISFLANISHWESFIFFLFPFNSIILSMTFLLMEPWLFQTIYHQSYFDHKCVDLFWGFLFYSVYLCICFWASTKNGTTVWPSNSTPRYLCKKLKKQKH